MPEYACGSCGGRLQVLEEHLGMVVSCPHCGRHVKTQRPVRPVQVEPPAAAPAPARTPRRAPEPEPVAPSAAVPSSRRSAARGASRKRGGAASRGGRSGSSASPASSRSASGRSSRFRPPTNGPLILTLGLAAAALWIGVILYVASLLKNAAPGSIEPSRLLVAGVMSCVSLPLFITAFSLGQAHRTRAQRAGVSPQASATIGWVVGMLGTIGWVANYLLGRVLQ